MAAGSWLLRLSVDDGGTGPEPVRPLSASATVRRASVDIGSGAVAWGVRTARRISEEIVATIPEYGPEHVNVIRRSIEAIVLVGLRGLRWGTRSGPDIVPAEALDSVRESVHQGVPLERVLRHLRIGHAALSDELMAAVELWVEPEERLSETQRVTRTMFQYADVLATAMADAYLAERERWRGSGAALRRGLVERIVAGSPIGDEDSASETLCYRLGQNHLAFIVWSDLGEDEPRPPEALHAIATGITQAVRASGALVVPVERPVVWGWTSWPRTRPADLAETIRRELKAQPGIRVATGPVYPGLAGMRRSHLCARQAQRVGQVAGTGRMCDYADVRLVALLTADEEQARWFVEDTLGELAAGDERTRELRETLRCYLAAERSLVAAAERLHVARNTVTYRVKRAEERLGRPTTENRVDVMLALELAETFACEELRCGEHDSLAPKRQRPRWRD